MARLRRALLLLAVFVGVASVMWLTVWVKQQRGAKMGERPSGDTTMPSSAEAPAEFVPPFRSSTFEGKFFSVASYEDKSAVIIDFWASWCDLCAADIPRLQDAAERYGTEKVVVVGIHRGDTESAEKGVAFAARVGVDYLLVQDPDGRIFALLGQGKPFMPLTLFINKEGKIMDRRFGPKTEEEIRVSMAKIVAP